MYYALCDRRSGGLEGYGLSCDEEGIFLADNIPLVTRSYNSIGHEVYKTRSVSEIRWLLTKAYGSAFDFSNQIEGLQRIARYMTDGKWVLAKIALVQLRFQKLPDDMAFMRAVGAEEFLAKCRCQMSTSTKTRKRDVADEPRVPAGQSGGGQWTTEGGSGAHPTNSLLIPAQAIAPPMPIPAPFELPMPPTGLNPPLPLEIPGVTREPANPYPDRPECVEEWAHAFKFCRDQEQRGKLKGGYGGFGKDFASCVKGMVSEACGGNPTA